MDEIQLSIVSVLFTVAVFFFLTAAGVALTVFLLRNRSITRDMELQSFQQFWVPVIEQCFWGQLPENLPQHLGKQDILPFLELWNHYQELFGSNNQSLNQLAYVVKLPDLLPELITEGGIREKLAALLAAGYLQMDSLWTTITEMCKSPNTITSLTAARALIHIDAKKAVHELVPIIENRLDWPKSRVAHFLLEAGQEAVSEPMSEAVLDAEPMIRPHLIRYLEMASYEEAMPVLKQVLQIAADDVESICAALFVIGTIGRTEDAEAIRPYLNDQDWRIRLRAITALGRLGSAPDFEVLSQQLSHPQWWVRYRAAQAMAALPNVDKSQLLTFSKSMTDHYGSDAITQVMAERQLAELA